mgnify:CR=1 FL=1
MLSYRHSFHAGNHADVLKHVVLRELLAYLTQKDKPLWYVDTHAGAGRYTLPEHPAAREEQQSGIARLWDATDAPAPVARYLDDVRQINPDGMLAHYPGSPWFAARHLRRDDRLWLSELHPADAESLSQHFGTGDRRVHVEKRDGFAALKAHLPPQPRRALVMVDPSYELASDYRNVSVALADAVKRFATGVYAIWYPMLASRESRGLPAALQAIAGPDTLHVTMTVREPAPGGMAGSGMFIVNPPYTLADSLNTVVPWLVERLGQDRAATWSLE